LRQPNFPSAGFGIDVRAAGIKLGRMAWKQMTRLLWATGAVWMAALPASAAGPTVVQTLDLGRAPSWFPVGFCLLTVSNRQYAAYYDEQHRLTVASRRLEQTNWNYQVLPAKVGWDSHNYITMAADDDGWLHLAGNMHVNPLVYFRTRRPWDIATFQRVTNMVGRQEDRCTYPKFQRGPKGELIFHYRHGSSGNGSEIFNVWDRAAGVWRRFLDEPLTDGAGRRNAYFHGPLSGPDGLFHLAWVWRDSPDCASNHDLCYARSRDLNRWETAAGAPLKLPLRLETPGVVVDPVPMKGGLLNGSQHLGFDSQKRVVLTYHKHDENGLTQAYAARFANGRWTPVRLTQWDYRWDFSGGGTISREIGLGPVKPGAPGTLEMAWSHIKFGAGRLVLSEQDLTPLGQLPPERTWPASHSRPETNFPGLRVQWARDLGASGEPGVFYALRWETLPPNRDRPRPEPLPPPSPLRLLKIRAP